MKSSASVWAAAALLLAVSVTLKIAAAPPPPDPAGRVEAFRRFLAANAAEQIQAVAGVSGGRAQDGWRFRKAACQAALYPSGDRGSLDINQRRHAGPGDRIAYVYRGKVRPSPPTWELAADVILYRLTNAFRRTREPGYAVMTYAGSCGEPPDLPWARLPTS